jgi:hypothetical protein
MTKEALDKLYIYAMQLINVREEYKQFRKLSPADADAYYQTLSNFTPLINEFLGHLPRNSKFAKELNKMKSLSSSINIKLVQDKANTGDIVIE